MKIEAGKQGITPEFHNTKTTRAAETLYRLKWQLANKKEPLFEQPEKQNVPPVEQAIQNLDYVNSLVQMKVISDVMPESIGNHSKIGSIVKNLFPTVRHDLVLTKEGVISVIKDNHNEPAEIVTEQMIRDWETDTAKFGSFKDAVRALAKFTPEKAIDRVTNIITN